MVSRGEQVGTLGTNRGLDLVVKEVHGRCFVHNNIILLEVHIIVKLK